MVSATVNYSCSVWECFSKQLVEQYQFLRCYFQNPLATGSLFPSSKALTAKMAAPIPLFKKGGKQLRILEVGAGTGVTTEAILKRIGKWHHLDVVELNPDLCATLRKKFGTCSNVTIYEQDILDYKAEVYDFVISGVPHNQFDTIFVTKIFKKYISLLKANGKLIYFEYKYPKKLSRFVLSRFEMLMEIQKIKSKIGKKYQEQISTVWWNFPPAKVRQLTKA